MIRRRFLAMAASALLALHVDPFVWTGERLEGGRYAGVGAKFEWVDEGPAFGTTVRWTDDMLADALMPPGGIRLVKTIGPLVDLRGTP